MRDGVKSSRGISHTCYILIQPCFTFITISNSLCSVVVAVVIFVVVFVAIGVAIVVARPYRIIVIGLFRFVVDVDVFFLMIYKGTSIQIPKRMK